MQRQEVQWQLPGERGAETLMGAEIHFENLRSVLEVDGGDAHMSL